MIDILRSRGNRVACRLGGHLWIDGQYHSTAGAQSFSTCLRCGTVSSTMAERGVHRRVSH